MGKKRIVKKSASELAEEREARGALAERASRRLPKTKVSSDRATVTINATYNNTLISLADQYGNVLSWSSAGAVGFEGTKKATPFAASRAAEVIGEQIKKLNIPFVDVIVRGIGSGRESAIRTLASKGINILSIRDATPVPHNGPRPPKVRRV